MRELTTIALAGLLGLAAAPAAMPPAAMPPAAAPAGPGETRVVLENDRVRAHRIDYPAGAATPVHEHAHPRVVVVLEGGTLEIRGADGVARTFHVGTGDVVWRPAEAHSIVNPGATTVRLVEVDVLGCDRAEGGVRPPAGGSLPPAGAPRPQNSREM